MTADALFTAILSRSDQLLWLWVAYLAGAAAALKFARGDRRWVAAGFLFAAYTHLESMRWVVKQWAAAEAAFVGTPAYTAAPPAVREAFDGVIHAPPAVWVVPFHLVLDAAVLAALWRAGRPAATMPVRPNPSSESP
jgi:hypothetical protein